MSGPGAANGPRRLGGLFALVAIAAAACTATQTREHTRESYRPPSLAKAPVARVFAAERSRVYGELLGWLAARSVSIEDEDPDAGRIVADLRFGSDAAQASAVAMGSVRTVVTATKRRYRSWWPFEASCDACIIRRGNLIGAETALVDDRVVPLSAADYEVAALLRAGVTSVSDGTRVELDVDFEIEPRSPPGLAPVSTGLLEETVLDALAAALASPPAG